MKCAALCMSQAVMNLKNNLFQPHAVQALLSLSVADRDCSMLLVSTHIVIEQHSAQLEHIKNQFRKGLMLAGLALEYASAHLQLH